MSSSQPIGVFDSGVGGLTVYAALRKLLPHEDFIYLGDTARLPYGTKSKAVVESYTLGAARMLLERKIKYLVVACNTISAQALDVLRSEMTSLPFCGVIEASAHAAIEASNNGHIAVLATEGTVRSEVYPQVIHSLNKRCDIEMLACNLLVSLVEEGWCEGAEAEGIVSRYLSMLKPGYDTLVLACTHFPILTSVIRQKCAANVQIVDGAEATALTVKEWLKANNAFNPETGAGRDTFLVTDMPARFARMGAYFLGRDIRSQVTETAFTVLPLEKATDKLNSSS